MFPKSFQNLIKHFSNLPEIGPKMAERLVLYLFKQEPAFLESFEKSFLNFRNNVRFCKKCFHICEGDFCEICLDNKRDKKTICVVQTPLDVIAIEKTRRYYGLYHVLGGNLSIMSKNEAAGLKIDELKKRLEKEAIVEVILANNPTADGDTTALYLARIIKPMGIKVTRLARGLATGGDIEHSDEITLSSAIDGRKEF